MSQPTRPRPCSPADRRPAVPDVIAWPLVGRAVGGSCPGPCLLAQARTSGCVRTIRCAPTRLRD